MFIKHGDKTRVISIEKTGANCDICKKQKINVDGEVKCGCSNSSVFDKSNKILTQNDFSANFQENKRVEDV